jgi:hypothetical protein
LQLNASIKAWICLDILVDEFIVVGESFNCFGDGQRRQIFKLNIRNFDKFFIIFFAGFAITLEVVVVK